METAALLAPALLMVLVVFVLPLVRFLSLAFTAPDSTLSCLVELGKSPVYRQIMLNSFVTAAVVTLITAVLAWPLAYVLPRARGLWFTLLIYGVLFPLRFRSWSAPIRESFC